MPYLTENPIGSCEVCGKPRWEHWSEHHIWCALITDLRDRVKSLEDKLTKELDR